MKFMLLKNKGGKYFQRDTTTLNEQVNSLRKFLSISPQELLDKIERIAYSEGITRYREGLIEVFEINTKSSTEAYQRMDDFSTQFKNLVYQNNHTMPLRYRFMDLLSEGYHERKLEDLATLRSWHM